MGTSHLIMGQTTDYITGLTVPDTHDERIIQRISRLLVEEKHFSKNEISIREKPPLPKKLTLIRLPSYLHFPKLDTMPKFLRQKKPGTTHLN